MAEVRVGANSQEVEFSSLLATACWRLTNPFAMRIVQTGTTNSQLDDCQDKWPFEIGQ